MTIAICIFCGSVKGGAFVPCPSCGKTPDTEDNMVRSFVLTDHHFPVQELQAISDRISSGVELAFEISPEVMQHMKAVLKLLGAAEVVAGRRPAN